MQRCPFGPRTSTETSLIVPGIERQTSNSPSRFVLRFTVAKNVAVRILDDDAPALTATMGIHLDVYFVFARVALQFGGHQCASAAFLFSVEDTRLGSRSHSDESESAEARCGDDCRSACACSS